MFAVGLNRGNIFFFDKLVVYEVDLARRTMSPDPDRDISTGGGTRLRWGASLEVVGNRLALHCTDRDYGDSCTINTFHVAATRSGDIRDRAKGTKRATKSATTKKKGKTRKPKRSPK